MIRNFVCFFCGVWAVLLPCAGQHLDYAYVVEHGELYDKYLPELVMLKSFQTNVNISKTINLDLEINVSPRGSGTMEIGGIQLYIYATESWMAHPEDQMLAVDFNDIESDGVKEMLVHGLVNYIGSRCTDIFERENVFFIYKYDVKKEKFVLNFRQASYDLCEENGNLSWSKRFDTDPKYKYFKELDNYDSSEVYRGYRVDMRFQRKKDGIKPDSSNQ